MQPSLDDIYTQSQQTQSRPSLDDLYSQKPSLDDIHAKSDPSMSGAIAQVGKGFYETMHQIPGVRQFMDLNPELKDMADEVPEPSGFGQKAARMAGQGAGFIPAAESGAALLSKAPMLGGAIGVGVQTGTGDIQDNKSIPETIKDVGVNTAGAYIGGKVLEGIGNAAEGLVKPASQRISDIVGDLYNKAVKPTIIKGNNRIANQSNANVESGVRAIINNKNNLELGEDGVKIPETLAHTSEAIAKTKDDIFNQYNQMQKQATGKGVMLSTNDIIPELEKIANNKAVKVAHPSTVIYLQGTDGAGGLISRLKEAGDLSPEEAQDMIKGFNGRLKAFYKNPSPNDFGTTSVDALVANNLRKNLDDVITNSVGEGYQGLKNQYGALSSMEKDVSRAAQRSANYQSRGLLDFTDVYTGEQIARGLLTGNLPEALSGIAGRGIKEWYKRLNSPNATIKNMFSKVSSLMEQEGKSSMTENLAVGAQKIKQSLGGLFDAIPARGNAGNSGVISKGGEVDAELLGGKALPAPEKPQPFSRTGPNYPQKDVTVNEHGQPLVHDVLPMNGEVRKALPAPVKKTPQYLKDRQEIPESKTPKGLTEEQVKRVSQNVSTQPKTTRPSTARREAQVDMSKGGDKMNLGKLGVAGTLAGSLALGGSAQAGQNIDMKKITQIESSGNPKAYNAKGNARGLNQLREPVLKEWNQRHPDDQHKVKDLFDGPTNNKIADWYINQRIPDILKHYHIADTTENRLKAYNFGAGNLHKGKPLPKETKDYIKKYSKL